MNDTKSGFPAGFESSCNDGEDDFDQSLSFSSSDDDYVYDGNDDNCYYRLPLVNVDENYSSPSEKGNCNRKTFCKILNEESSTHVSEGNLMNDSFKWSKHSFAKHHTNKLFGQNLNSINYKTSKTTKPKNKNSKKPNIKYEEVLTLPFKMEEKHLKLPPSEWFEMIISVFKEKRSSVESMTEDFTTYWNEVENPYEASLYMLKESSVLQFGERVKFMNIVLRSLDRWKKENKRAKTNMSSYISQNSDNKDPNKLAELNIQFHQLTQEERKVSVRSFISKKKSVASNLLPTPPDEDLVLANIIRLNVFQFLIECPVSLDFDLVQRLYEVGGNDDKNNYKPYIYDLVKKHEYVKAARCITLLNIQDDIPCDIICLPLLCEGKIGELQKYISGSRDLQICCIKLIDDFLGDESKVNAYLQSNDIPRANKLHLTEKSLFKLGLKFVKMYKMDESVCPNIFYIQSSKAAKFLIVKRFILEEIGCKEWQELIDMTVGNQLRLQLFLVNRLIEHYEVDEAVKQAMRFKIPLRDLPISLRESVEEVLEHKREVQLECPHTIIDRERFLNLSLPLSRVLWINTKQLVNQATDMILKGPQVVGYDSEWRPAFTSINHNNTLSLLQLASDEDIYIFDVINLLGVLTETEWQIFFEKIFCNPDILIIGYSTREDMQMLLKTFPFIKSLIRWFNIHDLEHVHVKLQEQSFMIDGWKKDERGLSDMVARCLGQPLDKTQQVSDWARRPLRDEQLMYAALDAFCLVKIYNFLLENHTSLMDDVKKDVIIKYSVAERESMKEESKKKKNLELAKEKSRRVVLLTERNKMSVGDLKFVCDSMLMGLGRQMRLCGVDTALLTMDDDHSKAAEIAMKENRIILTSGMPFEYLKTKLKVGSCYHVSSTHVYEQLVEVFNKFNIKVIPEDIFSRCQACNCNKYVLLSSTAMRELWAQKRKLMELNTLPLPKPKSNNETLGIPYLKNETLTDKERARNMLMVEYESTLILEEDNLSILKIPTSKPGSPNNISDDSEYSINTNLEEEGETATQKSTKYQIFQSVSAEIDFENVTLKRTGTPIQCEWLQSTKFDEMKKFYICTCCGKVFWEGFHHKSLEDKFACLFEKK